MTPVTLPSPRSFSLAFRCAVLGAALAIFALLMSAPPHGVKSAIDTDGDGFDDDVETYLGTDPLFDCTEWIGNHDAWPPDPNQDRTVDIFDTWYWLPPNHGQPVGGYPELQRLDLDQDGFVGDGDIDIMMLYFGVTCTASGDSDGDGVDDGLDNCPDDYNPGQEDSDSDGIGDVCDSDDEDGDGVPNGSDLCPGTPPGAPVNVFGCPAQPAIFSVRTSDITSATPTPCTASALLMLPDLTGSVCSRPPLAPGRFSVPGFLGLDLSGPFTDDLDAISMTELSELPEPAFHFSVDDVSVGILCTGSDVFGQASGSQAHGDIFTDVMVSGCNALYQDENTQGLNAPGLPLDDMDALTEPPIVTGPCVDPSAVQIPCPAFSVAASSSILGAIGAQPGDLLVPPGTPAIPPYLAAPCPVPNPCVAVTASALALDSAGAGTDDLDALCWFDLNENGLPDLPLAAGGPDQYYFSLAPGSATLIATGYSAADILVRTQAGLTLAVSAQMLGLQASDNLDALKCLDPDSDADGYRDAEDNCPFTSTPWFVPPGDDDCDGFTTIAEVSIGTDPNDPCGAGAWPADFDDNQVINTTDVFKVLPPYLGTSVPPTSPRQDLFPDGVINTTDVFKVLPPFLGSSCTP